MPHHLRLDLHLIELLTRVDPHHRPDHFRHDNHVSQVCLDEVGFLVGLRFLFCFAEFLDEAHGAPLEAAVEAAAGAGLEDVEKFGGGEVKESVQIKVSLCLEV